MSSINTNVSALSTYNFLTNSQQALSKTTEQIASGLRVNSAADDAAGLSIGKLIDTESRGIQVALRNTNDGVSLLQVADGALAQSTDILQRMRELTLQSSNGIYNPSDLNSINKEYNQLADQLQQIQDTTGFNGRSLFPQNQTSLSLQVGDQSNETLQVPLSSLNLGSLSSSTSPQARLEAIDQALLDVTTNRGDIGASINRLESAANTLNQSYVSARKSFSQIMDADLAELSSQRAKSQIQEQVGIAMLGQANGQQAQVLRILGQ